MQPSRDTFKTRTTLEVAGRKYTIYSLKRLEAAGFPIALLPFSLRILLENLLRYEDGRSVRTGDIEALGRWKPGVVSESEIAFMPARVLLQDFTGVPAVVDLAAMRDALAALGGDPRRINPLLPSELVIDHSGQVGRTAFFTQTQFPHHQHFLPDKRKSHFVEHRARRASRVDRIEAIRAELDVLY